MFFLPMLPPLADVAPLAPQRDPLPRPAAYARGSDIGFLDGATAAALAREGATGADLREFLAGGGGSVPPVPPLPRFGGNGGGAEGTGSGAGLLILAAAVALLLALDPR